MPAPDVAVPEIPLDLAAAVKLKKVWAGYEGLGRSVNPGAAAAACCINHLGLLRPHVRWPEWVGVQRHQLTD